MSESNIPEITIETYLYGCSGNYPVSDESMRYVLAKVNIPYGLSLALVMQRDRDMAEIELLKLILRDAGMTSSRADANGSWSHKEGAVEMNSIDKSSLKRQLNQLLKKYGMLDSTIRFQTFGMKVWQEEQR